MNRANRILPVYTGDVSGACSALFELGGMVVIHDPSGCNSTYNTHDETRWYDQDSLIFITGLTERDAILGNDDKLVADVVDAARELRPRFIALCNSPVPFISGTDFAALSKLIERGTKIPCFYVRTNGMHDYTVGAGNALAAIAQRFVEPADRRQGTANILGVTPLDFSEPGAVDALQSFVADAGFKVASCWAMGSSLDELADAAQAAVNLVVSSVGLRAAQVLHERFGTPYVVGTPTGSFSQVLAKALLRAQATGACAWPCRDVRLPAADGVRCIIGEPVAAGSRAVAVELDQDKPVRVICPLEAQAELLASGDVRVDGEEQAERALSGARLVIADSLYAPACPRDAVLQPWPHLAFSGRNSFGQLSAQAGEVSAYVGQPPESKGDEPTRATEEDAHD